MHRNFEEVGTVLSGARGSSVGGSGEWRTGQPRRGRSVPAVECSQPKCLVFSPSASEQRGGLLVALVDAACLAGDAGGGSQLPSLARTRWEAGGPGASFRGGGKVRPDDDLPWGGRLGPVAGVQTRPSGCALSSASQQWSCWELGGGIPGFQLPCTVRGG